MHKGLTDLVKPFSLESCGYPINQSIHHAGGHTIHNHRAGDGERADCRLWREEGGERLAPAGAVQASNRPKGGT